MLPKAKRLNLKKDFKWVVQGKKIETDDFKLFLRSGQNKNPKVGIATSKTEFKKATLRNKVKRKVFRAIEKVYHLLQSDLNLVIMPKASVFRKDTRELESELSKVLDTKS